MFAPIPDDQEYYLRERRLVAVRAQTFLASKNGAAEITATPHGNFVVKTKERIKICLNALDLWRYAGQLAS